MIILAVLVSTTFYKHAHKNDKRHFINSVLKQPAYSYLSTSVQDYIKTVYETTGQVVLTERNKEENLPYLNPSYIDYLNLSDVEKAQVDLIPDAYITDYVEKDIVYNDSLPTYYNLRNVNGKSYVSPFKDQGGTGICWAFAAVETAETFIMNQYDTAYSIYVPTFSVRQMDYVTAKDYLVKDAAWTSCSSISCSYTPWNNPLNGCRTLGDGGNFYVSTIAMGNGITLTDENTLPWTEYNYPKWPKDIMGYDKSLYEVDSTLQMPVVTYLGSGEALINSYINVIKNNILLYGGPTVGTYSPQSTCGFTNTDGTKALRIDDCSENSATANMGHAMQIIGWDDNYQYSYCKSGTYHYSANGSSCSVGTLMQGTGAWIVRNSWGNNNPYQIVYLTYDSIKMSVSFITSMSLMSTRSWDNNYHVNPWIGGSISGGMGSVREQDMEFTTNDNKTEIIDKIKFFVSSFGGMYQVSIYSGDLRYENVAIVDEDYSGLTVVDLKDQNIVVNDHFTVEVTGLYGSELFKDTISVFTQNVNDQPYTISYSNNAYDASKPITNDNPLYVNLTYNSSSDVYNWHFDIDSYIKNIPLFANLNYRIKKGSRLIDAFGSSSTYYNAEDQVYAHFSGDSSISYSDFNIMNEVGETWTMEILYNGVVTNSFPIKFNIEGLTVRTKSNVRLHANNGTDYYLDYAANDKTNNLFQDLNGNVNFYNNGYYITGWSTNADGTGTTYSVSEGVYVYHDMELYAQWSSEVLKVNVIYNCQEGSDSSCTGSMNSQSYGYHDYLTLPLNTFTKTGYVFKQWRIKSGSFSSDYYEEEQPYDKVSNILKYLVFNNVNINVYGMWSNNYVTITFDANGGTGNMSSINVDASTNARLKSNMFTKEGLYFIGWNTEPDGSKDTYGDNQLVNFSENKTLYAQWSNTDYKVVFNANGGEGYMGDQYFLPGTEFKLHRNVFVNNGYRFSGWNTAPDGSGTLYEDEQRITLDDSQSLYAQWVTVVPFTISEYPVDESNHYISKIKTGTELDTFVSKITLGYGYEVSVDYKSVNNKNILFTGGKTKILNGGNLYKEYTNIVIGDLNGDGSINSADLLKVRQHLLGSNILNGAYYISSDINNDNIINSADLLRIRQHLLGVKPVL